MPEDAITDNPGLGLTKAEAINLFFFSTSLKDSLMLCSNTADLVFLPEFFSSLTSGFLFLY